MHACNTEKLDVAVENAPAPPRSRTHTFPRANSATRPAMLVPA